jgi:uncharacterized membrane protein
MALFLAFPARNTRNAALCITIDPGRVVGRGGTAVRVNISERAASNACRAGAILVLAVFLQTVFGGCTQEAAKYPELRARDGVIAVDLSGIDPESGRFHTYRSDSGKKVDFFVYRESSGVPRAVLDACRTCYRWKKGYALDGKEVVCIKCDMRFKLDNLAQGTGSCVPVALKAESRDGTLLIPAAELETGARFF